MKKRLTLFVLSLLCGITFATAAIEDGVYSISCAQADGYVALGAYHDMAPYICFIDDGGTIAADGYWVVTNTRSGYTFRNEVSGEYIIFTYDRVDAYYKYMTLSTEPEERAQFWNVIENEDGSISVFSVVDGDYCWNLRASQGLLGTYRGTGNSINERYYLTKKGSTPGPGPGPDPDPDPEPEVMTKFPDAVHVFLTDGRIDAFPKDIVTNRTETGGNLVIETSVGQSFTYPLSSVDHVSEEAPADFPTFESYKFNNKFNDQLFTDAEGEMVGDTVFVTLAAIGKRLTPSFKLPDDQTLVYVNGELQQSKVTRRRFDHDTYYVVTREGIQMFLPEAGSTSTYSMQPYGRLVRVVVDWLTDRAEVPRIDIVTADGQSITSKTEFKDATITIDGHGIFPSMEATAVQIKGRGNSSWGWPKKPYRLKFEEKVKPLGMTKGKSWVLLSNYQTGSLMANAIGMKAANLMGAAGANHIVPVDLYLNGEYRGNYNLTEKVGFSNNSVDLEDETAAALLELDSYYDEPTGQKFRSMPYNLPINIKEPEFDEGTTSLTLETIQNDFNSFVTTLYKGQDLSQHVDIEQLIRFLMVNELINNYELGHPKSTFCYRESFESDTSKYVFGPVWDLDWAFGYEGHSRYYRDNATTNYWLDMPNWASEVKQFIQDLRWRYEPMSARYQELWEKFMEEDLTELLEFCQDYYDFAYKSFRTNADLWGDWTNYEQQVSTAASWLETRANKIYQDMLDGVRPEPVEPVDPVEPIEFANDKLYTITCKRGGLCLTEDHFGLDAQQTREQWLDWGWGEPVPEEEKQFAIINIEGNNYLYSPLTNAYLRTGYVENGEWVDYLGSPIFFDTSNSDGEYLYMISTRTDAGTTLWFNNNGSKIVINSWNTPDDGDRWKIEEVADFDPTEALRIAQGSLYAVTTNLMYDGQIIASETKDMPYGAELPTPPSDWSNAFVTLNPVGNHPLFVTAETTVAYEAKWAGPFAFTTSLDDVQWYNMTIRSEYMVGKNETEPYVPVAVPNPDTLRLETFQWAFGGTPYKVKVYNRATGLDETLALDDKNAVMRPGDYSWEILPNSDGFVLRAEGTPFSCLNQIGGKNGPLQTWTDSKSLTDNGSTFRVSPAPAPYDGIRDLAEPSSVTPRPSSYIVDLTGRRLDHIRQPGIYIINGRKRVVRK